MEFYVVSTSEGSVHNELFISLEDAREFKKKANEAGKPSKIYRVRPRNRVKEDVNTAMNSITKASKEFADSIKGAVGELLRRDS